MLEFFFDCHSTEFATKFKKVFPTSLQLFPEMKTWTSFEALEHLPAPINQSLRYILLVFTKYKHVQVNHNPQLKPESMIQNTYWKWFGGQFMKT